MCWFVLGAVWLCLRLAHGGGSPADTHSEASNSPLCSPACARLLASATAQGSAPLQLGVRLSQHKPWLERLVGASALAECWDAPSGSPAALPAALPAPVLFQLAAPTSGTSDDIASLKADVADAWLVPSHELAQLAASGAAADVGRLLQADRGSGWWGVAPQFREALALYGGTVAAVPLGAGPLLMFVRSDVLAATGRPAPPQSWQALLAFAEAYDGLRRPQDPPHALCLPAGPDCTQLHLLHAVWASVAQTRGRRQGLYFDPWTGAPRLDTAALRYALQLLANLSAAAAPPQPRQTSAPAPADGATCDTGDMCACPYAADTAARVDAALSGCSCAVTIAAGAERMQVMQACLPPAAPAAARYDVYGAPGSETVWNDETDTLMACTAAACPHADMVEAPASEAGSTSASASAAASQGAQQQPAGPGRLVNRSPWLTASSLVGVINNRSSPETQMRAYLLLSALALRLRCGWSSAGNSTAGPLEGAGALARMGHIEECYVDGGRTAASATPAATAAPASGPAAAAAVEQLWRNLLRVSRAEALHPGGDWDLGVATPQQQLRAIMLSLLASATLCGSATRQAGMNASAALGEASVWSGSGCWAALQTQLRSAQAHAAVAYPPEAILPSLRKDLDLDHMPASHAVLLELDGKSALHKVHQLVLVVLGVTCGTVMLMALVLLLQRRRLTLLGHVVAKVMPPARRGSVRPAPFGLDACLVVTDIQDSTSLWEALPPVEMDTAIDAHHACLRKLLLKHEGYESATEGDSFILGFWTPYHALAFTLEAQTALLDVAWPARLLEETVCSPIFTSLQPGWPFTAPRPSDDAELRPASSGIPSSQFLSPRSSAPARMSRHMAEGLSTRSMLMTGAAALASGLGGFSRASSQLETEVLPAAEPTARRGRHGGDASPRYSRPSNTPTDAASLEYLPVDSYDVLRDMGREGAVASARASNEYGAGSPLPYDVIFSGGSAQGSPFAADVESYTGSGLLGLQDGLLPPMPLSPTRPRGTSGGIPAEALWAAATTSACPVDPAAGAGLGKPPATLRVKSAGGASQTPPVFAMPSRPPAVAAEAATVSGEPKARRPPPHALRVPPNVLGGEVSKDVRPSLDLPQAAKHLPAARGAISNPLTSFKATAVASEQRFDVLEGDSSAAAATTVAGTRDSGRDRRRSRPVSDNISSGTLVDRRTNSGVGARAVTTAAANAAVEAVTSLGTSGGDQNDYANAAVATLGTTPFSTSSAAAARAAGAARASAASPGQEPYHSHSERLGEWLRRLGGNRSNTSSASGAPGANPCDPPPAYVNRQRRELADDVYDSATEHCVLKGLRVRMGVSLAPTNPAEVSHNAASQRTVYGGAAAALAKAVSDAAHGGMVTLTGAVFERLQFHAPAKLQPHFAIRAGRFTLGSAGGETDVYTIWPESLTQRMALLPPPRCLASAVSPCVYDAPVRRAAVAVLHVPALPALKAWDGAVTLAAVAVLCGVAQREARRHGGYLVLNSAHERAMQLLSDGGQRPAGCPAGPALLEPLVAAFSTALDAARWALAVQEALAAPDCPWPPALLQHELCRETTLPLLEETHPSQSGAVATGGLLSAHTSGHHLQHAQSPQQHRRSGERSSLTGLVSSSSAGRWLQGHLPQRKSVAADAPAAQLRSSSSAGGVQPQPQTNATAADMDSPRAAPAPLAIAPPVMPEVPRHTPGRGSGGRVSTPLPAGTGIVSLPTELLRKRGSADTATAQLIRNQQHRAMMLRTASMLRAQSYAAVRSALYPPRGGAEVTHNLTDSVVLQSSEDEHTHSAPLPVFIASAAAAGPGSSSALAHAAYAQYATSAAMASAGPMMRGALGLPSAWPRLMYARPCTAWRPVLDVAEERSGGSSDDEAEHDGTSGADRSSTARKGRRTSASGGAVHDGGGRGGAAGASAGSGLPAGGLASIITGGARGSLDSEITPEESSANATMHGEEALPADRAGAGAGAAPGTDSGTRVFLGRSVLGRRPASRPDAQQARLPSGGLPSISKLLLRPSPAAAGLRQVDVSSTSGSFLNVAAAAGDVSDAGYRASQHQSLLLVDSDAGGRGAPSPLPLSQRLSLRRNVAATAGCTSGGGPRLDMAPSAAASPHLTAGESEAEGNGTDGAPSPFTAAVGADAVRSAASGWTMVVRGLRCSMGLDVGAVGWCVPPATARLAYTGHAMLRAEKLAHRARPGQVVLSERANEQVGTMQLAQMEEWMDGAQKQGGFQMDARPSQQQLQEQPPQQLPVKEGVSAERGLRTLGRPLMTAQLPKPATRLRRGHKRPTYVCRFTRWDQAFGAMYAQVCSPPQPVSTAAAAAQLRGALLQSKTSPRASLASSQGGGTLHSRLLSGWAAGGGRGPASPPASQLSREGSIALGAPAAAAGRSPAGQASPRSTMEGMLFGAHKMASGMLIAEGHGAGDGPWLGSVPLVRTPPHTPPGGGSYGSLNSRSRLSAAGAVLTSVANRLFGGSSIAAAAAAAAFGGAKADDSAAGSVTGSSATRLHVSSFQAAVQAGNEQVAATSAASNAACRPQDGMLSIGQHEQLIATSAPVSPAGSIGNLWQQAASAQHMSGRQAQAAGWQVGAPALGLGARPLQPASPYGSQQTQGGSGSGSNWVGMGAAMPLMMCTRLDELDEDGGGVEGANKSHQPMPDTVRQSGPTAGRLQLAPTPEGVVVQSELHDLLCIWPGGGGGGGSSATASVGAMMCGGAPGGSAKQVLQAQAQQPPQRMPQAAAPQQAPPQVAAAPQQHPRAPQMPTAHPMELLRGKSDFLDSSAGIATASHMAATPPPLGQNALRAPQEHLARPGAAGERSTAGVAAGLSDQQQQSSALTRLPSGYPLSAPTAPTGQRSLTAAAAGLMLALPPLVQPSPPLPLGLRLEAAPLPKVAAALPTPLLGGAHRQPTSDVANASSSVTFMAPAPPLQLPGSNPHLSEEAAGSAELWPRRYVPIVISPPSSHRGSRILTQLGGGGSSGSGSGSPMGSYSGRKVRKHAARPVQQQPDDGELDVDFLTRRGIGASGSGSGGSSTLSFGKGMGISAAMGMSSGLGFGGLAAAAEAELAARHTHHVLPGLPEEACVVGGDSGGMRTVLPVLGTPGRCDSSGSSGDHSYRGGGRATSIRRHSRHAVWDSHARDMSHCAGGGGGGGAPGSGAPAAASDSRPRLQQHEIDSFFAGGGAPQAVGSAGAAAAQKPRLQRCSSPSGEDEDGEEGSGHQPAMSDHVLLTMDGLVDAAAPCRLSVRSAQQLSSLEFWVGGAGAAPTARTTAAAGCEGGERDAAADSAGGLNAASMRTASHAE
ncbi:hypothetical protein HYH02_000253 [Chlamydomonas schloesseri]|uniref:Guanylate cyclase domain-containing protein n=1 Tax=Chlamydomonas schloesseri TaxID=2026947 RepID=A0A835WNH1_9CHLO|nr:hypothetical protein HYH02_000253 [Chlamydomonas schloesseri]|eukprot:KAG2450151.1 hypothetical protein HYH02_000253 [Chlamydomonas schloesseri]